CLLRSQVHSPLLYLFILRLPPQPRSTLFPYTTLFRSVEDQEGADLVRDRAQALEESGLREDVAHVHRDRFQDEHGLRPPGARIRSEEHTSELQSRFDLVCRLLLEKKKKKKKKS